MSIINELYTVKKITQISIIAAPINRVFSLICPVMEYEWIPGWKCELINFPNGKIGKDCVFKEIMSAPFLMGKIISKTKWTVVFNDKKNYKIHFRLENQLSNSLYKIEMKSINQNKTECTLEINYKPINKTGQHFIETVGESKISFLLSALSVMLKKYCESGNMISSDKKLPVFIKNLTPKEKSNYCLIKQ